MKYSPETILQFPYSFGPTIRGYSIPLLWSGRIITSLPGFVSSNPFRHFYAFFEGANSSSLSRFLHYVNHHAMLAKSQALEEVENCEPLQGHIVRAILIGPGGMSTYEKLDEFPQEAMHLASLLLNDLQILNTACVEFIWRVYEHCLEMGATPEQPLSDQTPVIRFFEERGSRLGDNTLLLAECLLHRISLLNVSVSENSSPSLITSHDDNLQLMRLLGNKVITEDVADLDQARDVLRSQIGFSLFRAALSPYWKLIEPPFTNQLANVLSQRSEELLAARNYCLDAASDIVGTDPNDEVMKKRVASSLSRIEDEIGAILDLDKNNLQSVFRKVTEDPVIWGSVATMLGCALGTFPEITSVAAAVTAFSRIGATALKESRHRRDTLKKSPWSAVYYLK